MKKRKLLQFLSIGILTSMTLFTIGCINNDRINIKVKLSQNEWESFKTATKQNWKSGEEKIRAMILNYTAFKNGTPPNEFPYPSY